MNTHRKLLGVAATAAALATATAAYAGTSPLTPDVFGNGGGDPAALSATCQRQPVHIPFGRTWRVAKPGVITAMTIVDTELKCVTFHLLRVGNCEKRYPVPALPAEPVEKNDHGLGKPGDWAGITQLYTYDAALNAREASVQACIENATGVGQ